MRRVVFFPVLVLLVFRGAGAQGGGMIIDHHDTDITALSEEDINLAKATLHIGYGHTSHGSQLTSGMTGLVAFANNGGKDLSLPQDMFAWNNGGIGGALDLEEGDGYGDGWLDHDCGYYPNWVNETRVYLDDASHADVNVIIWSWCGQVSSRTEQGMIDTYLAPMTQLEIDYPDVSFVYMTGHVDGGSTTGNLFIRNQQIRDYCSANGKILYDFADIESWDPDGAYYGDKLVTDACDYDSDADGVRDRNWATDWQNSHTEGVDWFNCSSAHSQPLNANQKAYAAWALWTQIATAIAAPLLGDVNLDEAVNGLDVEPFVDVLVTGVFQAEADMNQDGAVNGLDVDLFADAVVAGMSLTAVPEPNTAMLVGSAALALIGMNRRRRRGAVAP